MNCQGVIWEQRFAMRNQTMDKRRNRSFNANQNQNQRNNNDQSLNFNAVNPYSQGSQQ